MSLGADDITAIILTLKLALVTATCLVVLSVPLALLLYKLPTSIKSIMISLLTLPLVLPPTVLGFYLLMLMGPDGLLGDVARYFNIERLNFSFLGIVIASMVYSLPFAVQPIYQAFSGVNQQEQALAKVMGLDPLKRFLFITLAQSKIGLLTAFVMSFAHTLGEFGVVLMVGGNIKGVSRVVSIQIFDHVESLNWHAANQLSLVMLIISFLIIFVMYWVAKGLNRKNQYAISF